MEPELSSPRTLRLPLALLLAAVLAGATACGTTGLPSPGNPDEITRQQILDVGATTALDAVERLRPRWLRTPMDRSFSRNTEVVVFLDGVLVGSIDSLRDIEVVNVRHLRWLDSAQAGQMPGLGSRHVAGAIVVETL